MAEQAVQVCEASGQVEGRGEQARDVLVTLIRAGESKNGHIYTPAVLQEAAMLFEGATAFCDHGGVYPPGPPTSGGVPSRFPPTSGGVPSRFPPTSGGQGGYIARSVRDVAGAYRNVAYADGRLQGILRLVDGDLARLVEQVVRDRQRGLAGPNIGLSADMVVALTPPEQSVLTRGVGERPRRLVERIIRVNSVDVVFDPAAGGAFERIVEGRPRIANTHDTDGWRGSGTTASKTPKMSAAHNERVQQRRSRDMSEMTHEAWTGREGGPNLNPGPLIPGPGSLTPDTSGRMPDPGALTPDPGTRLATCGDALAARLAASGLPEAARRQVAGQFVGRVFEASELEAAIGDMRALVGSLTGQATVQGAGAGRIQMGMTMRERVQWAAERLFGLAIPDHVRESVPHAGGLRELFQAAGFDGRFGWEMRRITEANEVTTSVMANIVGTAMNKRLVKDYANQPKWWKPIAVEVPVRDMKQQERIRLNDFAALATVNENDAYANLAWDDAKETYTPAKRGNIVYVTLETIINDDLRAVQSIPKKLARAAGVTINEFVSGLFTANSGEGAAMADTYRVFNAAQHQSNLGAAALDATSFGAGMAAIAKMTDTASKRMGLVGKWLLIPPDLEQAAFTLLYSQLKPGTANNDANFFQGRAQYIVVPQFTDANNWYLLADPGQIELIEIGYLGGQDAPELLVQDDPTAGTVFTNDAISYKVRWIFGGGWLDYRGAYGAVVA